VSHKAALWDSRFQAVMLSEVRTPTLLASDSPGAINEELIRKFNLITFNFKTMGLFLINLNWRAG